MVRQPDGEATAALRGGHRLYSSGFLGLETDAILAGGDSNPKLRVIPEV